MKSKKLTNNQQKIIIEVSLWEAAMILKLRKYDYGEFKIVKMNGNPTRIIFEGSEMLKADDGLILSIDKKNTESNI